MSKPKEPWWPYMQNILYNYPHNMRQKELSKNRKKEIRKIQEAMEETECLPDGKLRCRLIEMLYFRQSHNLHGAAAACYVSYSTAKRWRGEFLHLLADKLGVR